MTPGLEFEGKTVDHAVDEACKHLHTSKDDLRYDVLSYGSTGIFGLVGTKKARIRVKAPNQTPGRNPEATDTAPEPSEVPEKGRTGKEEEAAPAVVEPTEKEAEMIAVCTESLQKIVDAITSDAEISIEKSDHRILFAVKGGNAGVLIGKRGQTLEAIQYIIEKIAIKQNDTQLRIEVDVEDYLKTRKENLESLAIRLAQKAVRTGKPMTIGQMSSHDRRIVHLSLKNNSGVRTQSLGEGLYRKLMIFPKTKGAERRARKRVPSMPE